MARNEEKAPFIVVKAEEEKRPIEDRYLLAFECHDRSDADKRRQQIIREIGSKVADIQNEGLDEHRVINLNGEINRLILEKSVWESRIHKLGGPKYAGRSAKMIDLDLPDPGVRTNVYDFYYFGAAKKLPHVREFLEKPPELRKPRTDNYKRIRTDNYKQIDARYYGYRDEEKDGPAEKKMRLMVDEIRREAAEERKKILLMLEDMRREAAEERKMRRLQKIEKAVLLEMKKMELVSSEGLLEESSEAKDTLNIQL